MVSKVIICAYLVLMVTSVGFNEGKRGYRTNSKKQIKNRKVSRHHGRDNCANLKKIIKNKDEEIKKLKADHAAALKVKDLLIKKLEDENKHLKVEV